MKYEPWKLTSWRCNGSLQHTLKIPFQWKDINRDMKRPVLVNF